MNTIQINPADNVIVALSPLAKGTAVTVPGVGEVVAAEDIPQGHKMAVRAIAAREDVVKYGLPIGHVTGDIQPGQWLHTHNVKTNLSGEVEYAYNPTHPVVEPVEPETFMGFRRADGRALPCRRAVDQRHAHHAYPDPGQCHAFASFPENCGCPRRCVRLCAAGAGTGNQCSICFAARR